MNARGTIYCGIWSCLLSCVLAAPAARAAGSGSMERAVELYQKTEYQQALGILEANPDDKAATFELIGKSYYMLDDFKKATHFLEKAVELDPTNSDYLNWLGKVYGRRAETSSFFTAWSYAGKCHRYFERALEEDPKNLEAIDDLFEFTLNAPGALGGGMEKAAAIAAKTEKVNREKYHSLEARLAEKQKDFPSAERQIKLAMEAGPSDVGRILDMAEFLARRGRYDESEAYFERARKVAPDSAQLKFERAKTYLRTGRKRDEARKLLEQYLSSMLTPEDPPRSEAQRLLKEAASG